MGLAYNRFEVTQQHLDLLGRMYFNYNDDTEFGAPEVDPKRPYGNSDVYNDIGEILGVEPVVEDGWGDKEFSPLQKQEFDHIHQSMTTVLNILTSVAVDGIKPGWYATANAYSNDWKREDDV